MPPFLNKSFPYHNLVCLTNKQLANWGCDIASWNEVSRLASFYFYIHYAPVPLGTLFSGPRAGFLVLNESFILSGVCVRVPALMCVHVHVW